ncbi:MAG: DUF4421 family protein [Flavobacteriaceae bacterium]|nr:DUF4421 family protein [Flavobacteriaceae bacterium]
MGQSRPLDSTSIISYGNQIIVKANVDTQTDMFRIRSKDDDNLQLSANSQFRLFLSVDYEFIGLSIGVSPKFLPGNGDNNLRGESSFTDYSFRFFLKNWTQELQYKKIEGYYVENTGDFVPNWVEGRDPYFQFSDLETIFWGGSTSYVLNPKFSLRNVVYNTEWQRKSAGSFIPTLRYGFSRIEATLDEVKSAEDSYDIQFAPDYYYTWVLHENWFVSPFISPGAGIRFSKERDEVTGLSEHNVYWPVSLDGGLQLGYSAERIIFGVIANSEATWYNEDERTNVENNQVFAKIYFGYRLQPPKVVKKSFYWLNEQFGL